MHTSRFLLAAAIAGLVFSFASPGVAQQNKVDYVPTSLSSTVILANLKF